MDMALPPADVLVSETQKVGVTKSSKINVRKIILSMISKCLLFDDMLF